MRHPRKSAVQQRAIPLFFFAMIAAVPFATFGASPKNKVISNTADIQFAAAIGNIGETR